VTSGAPNVRRSQIRYVVVFAVLSTTLLFAYSFPYENGGVVDWLLRRYLHGYAWMAAAIVRLFDPTAQASGQQIYGRFSMQIVRDCDAMQANILYSAAICAYPAPVRMKATGWLVGVGAIAFANLVRLCTLYIVGMKAPSAFEFAHEAAPPLILLATLGCFGAWAGSMGRATSVST
jgi:exosortase/archaeosortase family protein